MAKKELPEVKDEVRLTNNFQYALFRYKRQVFNENPIWLLLTLLFFLFFDFKLIKGNNENPLRDNNSIVITETTAKKIFWR